MSDELQRWRDAFSDVVAKTATADSLKKASLEERLKDWTSCLTSAVVRSCEKLGWDTAAKGHPSKRLPQSGKEFLSLDITAFASSAENDSRWPLPVAVFELENKRTDDRVAYSLWKVMCIRTRLRVVFAFRRDWERSRELVSVLQRDVIGSFSPTDRANLDGETLVVVGNRGEGETFPWGFFKFWRLDTNTGRFEKN